MSTGVPSLVLRVWSFTHEYLGGSMVTQIVGVHELAEILGTTADAIRSNLRRKNYDAVPPPVRLGRRVVWTLRQIEEFISEKEKIAAQRKLGVSVIVGQGRPSKEVIGND